MRKRMMAAVTALGFAIAGYTPAIAQHVPTEVSVAQSFVASCEVDREPAKDRSTQIVVLNRLLQKPKPQNAEANIVAAYREFLKAKLAHQQSLPTVWTIVGYSAAGGVAGFLDVSGGSGIFTYLVVASGASESRRIAELGQRAQQAAEDVRRIGSRHGVVLLTSGD